MPEVLGWANITRGVRGPGKTLRSQPKAFFLSIGEQEGTARLALCTVESRYSWELAFLDVSGCISSPVKLASTQGLPEGGNEGQT